MVQRYAESDRFRWDLPIRKGLVLTPASVRSHQPAPIVGPGA
ncbi:hypothetical protein [Synechococcus sp. MIT S1220]